MPLPTVLGLLLKKDKPTWTMEKTWAGRGAQKDPAPSPAAAACKFASLPTTTRRQRKGSPEPPEAPAGTELPGNRVHPPPVGGQESTASFHQTPQT